MSNLDLSIYTYNRHIIFGTHRVVKNKDQTKCDSCGKIYVKNPYNRLITYGFDNIHYSFCDYCGEFWETTVQVRRKQFEKKEKNGFPSSLKTEEKWKRIVTEMLVRFAKNAKEHVIYTLRTPPR